MVSNVFMRFKIFSSTFSFFFLPIVVFSQSFHVNNLFSPGLTMGIDYPMAAKVNDSVDFQMTKYKVQFVKPLKTKLGVSLKNFDLKKADAKASQIFIATKFSVAQPELISYELSNIYKGEIEFTAITASVRNGIWAYSANIYAEETSSSISKHFTPNLRAYVAYVNIKNLRIIHFYGASLIVNQGKIVPLPLFGFRAKINSKLKTEIIFPVHLKFNYNITTKSSFDLAGYFSGINTIYRKGSAFQGNDNSINFRELKTYFAYNLKLSKHYKLKLETGYAFLRTLHGISSDYKETVRPSTYFSLSFNYNFGHSVFGNFVGGNQ